jgi:hypothetical protein
MSQLFSDKTAPRLFERIIDRNQTALPSDYLPEAPGALIAGADMLRAAGHTKRRHRPHGWSPRKPGVFRKPIGNQLHLQVRQCGNARSDHWTIEVVHVPEFSREWVEALVCAFSGRPIWVPTYQGAMRIAEHCHPLPRPPVAGRWAKAR